MTDEVAIVTKAKENIMFVMAAMSPEDRLRLSYAKHDLIHKCSFNGAACNIDKDFDLLLDPAYGACYTFHGKNHAQNMTSSRAGPMYGLRVMLYVDVNDYLKTTEATGIRVTVHSKQQYPYPDTFGFSAPTGMISSFGIKMQRVHRLLPPDGECWVTNIKHDIFEGYEYSVEGCYRSCFQTLVSSSCLCGDPRFPTLKNIKHCEAGNPRHRNCLKKRIEAEGGMHGIFQCVCKQPCVQSTYTQSYSASRWPSDKLDVKLGNCSGTKEECVEDYEENGVMLEVFYERLNYEVMIEGLSYGIVNVLGDFGGQLGLWIGISVITCFEFFMMIWQILHVSSSHYYHQYQRKKAEKAAM